MRIYKWTLEITDEQTLPMPANAEILCVQIQHGEPQLWALCDEVQFPGKRTIYIYGTGNPISKNPGKYIGTFQTHNGKLIWHVFEAVQ